MSKGRYVKEKKLSEERRKLEWGCNKNLRKGESCTGKGKKKTLSERMRKL